MPHLFLDRPRLLNLAAKPSARQSHFFWESLNAGIYLAGGAIFIAGSFFFFPTLEEYQDTGCLLFFLGSLLYLVVTGHDMAEVWARRHQPRGGFAQRLGENASAFSYLTGTVLFTVGSVFFSSLLNWGFWGAWTFILGSACFVAGAMINVLQIVRADSMAKLVLLNLTAVAFLVGSVLFTVASVPYLWHFEAPHDGEIVYGFLAWQYLVGSALFLAGGLFNYGRACLVLRGQAAG